MKSKILLLLFLGMWNIQAQTAKKPVATTKKPATTTKATPKAPAVVEGIFATIATLIFVPVVFALAHEKDHLNSGKQHV